MSATVTLRDGTEVLIRPIEPSDKAALQDGIERLSPESRYRRFLSPVDSFSASQLRYLTEVDHHDHEALAAFDEDEGLIGVARYVRTSEPDAAEVAVAVMDDWQGRGLGTCLLRELSDSARANGVERFTALLLAKNDAVTNLLEGLGPTERRGAPGPGMTELDIDLEPSTEPGSPLRQALGEAAKGFLELRDKLLPPR